MKFLQKTMLAGAVLAASTSMALAEVTTITFVLAADVYEMSPSKGRGGFGKLSAMVDAEKANNPNTLYVHAGDAFSPSLMSSFDKGEHIVELMNFTPPDIFVPGNHEFDFGPDVYKERIAEAKFAHVLAANMSENGELLADDHEIFEFNGVKVGIYGLAAEDTPVKSSPGSVEFAAAVETGLAQKAALKAAGADIIVAVTHSGKAVDRALIDNKVADVILSGDDHDLDIFYNGKVAFAEPISDAKHVVAVDLEVDVKDDGEKRKVRWWPNFRVVDSANFEPHPAVDARVQELEGKLSAELDVTLGETNTSFDTTKPSVRGGESAFGNMLADAMRQAVGADIAITNGGGIRAGKTYAEGEAITRRHILEELPFGNVTVMLGLTGEQVIAALENGVSAVEGGAGRFPHVSNLSFTADITKPAGERVSEVMVGGVAIDPAATYKVATNDYMGNGGDGYSVMKNGNVLIRATDGKLMANDLMVYIRKNAPVSPAVEGRVNLVR